MFDFYLPMAEEFERIFLENEVYEWEAKDFWQKIDQTALGAFGIPKRQKAYMYSAIKTLTILKYLVSKPSPYNHRVFLYTSTQKLKNLCNRESSLNLKTIINKEKSNLINELETCVIQVSIITEMFPKYSHLKKELIVIKNELNFEKHKLENKINAITLLLEK